MYFWLGFKKLEYLLGFCLVIYRKSQENVHKISILHFRNVYSEEEGLELALLGNRLCNVVHLGGRQCCLTSCEISSIQQQLYCMHLTD